MKREMIVDNALNAYTLAECKAAEKQLREWLQAHPQDLGLHEVAGSLGIAKAAALEREDKSTLAPIAIETDEPSTEEMATLIMAGGAFDWLADEPDHYSAMDGKAI